MRTIKIKYAIILIYVKLYFKTILNFQQENYVFKNIYEYKFILKLLNKTKNKIQKITFSSFFLIHILYCNFQ
jgi:hypothetical protein